VRGKIKFAIFFGMLSVVVAIGIGVAALQLNEETTTAAQAGAPIQGNYTFATSNIVLDTPFAARTELVITGGRLSIGADGHTFWSLQMHSKTDASSTGRLSCEGRFDSVKRTIAPSPRYGYDGFAIDLANADVQRSIYEQYCAGAGLFRPDTLPLEVSLSGATLQVTGRGGSISWRRE
jgi:hypothetical protein